MTDTKQLILTVKIMADLNLLLTENSKNVAKRLTDYMDLFDKDADWKRCTDAMRYSLISSGKAIRPFLAVEFAKLFGGDAKMALSFGCGVEMMHASSLIHDDLPAMDNDDMRRGKPSLHKKYKEDIAILTGDELLTESFGIVANSKDYDNDTKVKIISALSKYAGLSGMVYGQLLDITSNGKKLSKEELFDIQDNKTAGLFKIACLIACYIGKDNNEEFYLKLGSLIGEIFQNQDDLFDIIKTQDELGKTKSDIQNDKATALSIYDIDSLKKLIDDEFNYLENYLNYASFNKEFLLTLINKLRNR